MFTFRAAGSGVLKNQPPSKPECKDLRNAKGENSKTLLESHVHLESLKLSLSKRKVPQSGEKLKQSVKN